MRLTNDSQTTQNDSKEQKCGAYSTFEKSDSPLDKMLLKCEFCNKEFSRGNNLNRHKRYYCKEAPELTTVRTPRERQKEFKRCKQQTRQQTEGSQIRKLDDGSIELIRSTDSNKSPGSPESTDSPDSPESTDSPNSP